MKKLRVPNVLLMVLFCFTACTRSGNNNHKQPEIITHTVFSRTFIKAEKLEFNLSGLITRIVDLSKCGKEWIGSRQMLVETKDNSTFSLRLNSLIERGYSITLYYTKGPDYGNVGIYIGDKKYGEIAGYNPVISPGNKITLPDMPNPSYRLEIRFAIEGKDERSKGFYTGLEGIDLIPQRNWIGEWFLIGPFANIRDSHNNWSGLDSIYPPEESVDLKGKYWGEAGQPLYWKYVETPGNGYFSLKDLFKPNEPVGYTVTYIHTVENSNCVLFAGSDIAMKIFFNNQEIYKYTGIRHAEPDQAMIILHVKRGWNKLLLKFEISKQRCGFFARLLDPDNVIFISAAQKNPFKLKK